MKQLLMLAFFAVTLVSCASCSKNSTPDNNNNNNNNTNPTGSKMRLKIGHSTFTATLYDNQTATAFKSLLPLNVSMVELNGNEKYVDLPRTLSTNASHHGTIEAGDLMLYGSSTLVLFYKTFSPSYNYSKLGRIDNPSGLAAALGTGNVTISFELEQT